LGERAARCVLIDLSPLRRSRDLRRLVLGELVSVLGTQLTTVAVPYQVYQLTRSSFDAMDRRRVLMAAQVLMACCSAGLAVNADLGPSLWPLFVLPALAAGFGALDDATRSAIVPNLVQRSEVPAGTPFSRLCSSSAWWRGQPWPGCCWLARASGSCTGWMWPVSGPPRRPRS
jgi:hypothetical protein